MYAKKFLSHFRVVISYIGKFYRSRILCLLRADLRTL